MKIKSIILILLALSQLSLFCSGQNIYRLWSGANQWEIAQQSEEDQLLQLNAMKKAGISVLRIFICSRTDQDWENPNKGWKYEYPLGVFHDDQIQKIDKLMKECSDLDIKLVVTLSSFAVVEDSMPAYYEKFGIVGMYKQNSIDAFKNRFKYLLNHKNPYLNNVKWKDLTNLVLAWEISNESGTTLVNQELTDEERYSLNRHFLTELSMYLKSLSPDIMVSLGIAGYDSYYNLKYFKNYYKLNTNLEDTYHSIYFNKHSGDDIAELGNIKDADIYTLHFYGGDLNQWINDSLPLIRSWNKVLFIEEFGNTRGDGEAQIIKNYTYTIDVSEKKGIPWMFWRMGLRVDSGTWSVMDYDNVWQDVIVPESIETGNKTTTDNWGELFFYI